MKICAEGLWTAKFFLIFAIVSYVIARLIPNRMSGHLATVISFVLYLLALFSLFFFRDPERISPADEHTFYSPADGKVIEIEKRVDVITVKIFMSVFNVHVQRMPVTATVEKIEYLKGSFKNAMAEDADSVNERNISYFVTPEGMKFQIKQIAGLIARRIKFTPKVSQKVMQGDRIGLIYFGSQVDAIIKDDNAEILVNKGQKVVAGITPVFRLKQR